METDGLPIRDIQRVRLEPGDVLVVRYDCIITVEAHDRIKRQLSGAFPNNRVLVFDSNPQLSVIESAEER